MSARRPASNSANTCFLPGDTRVDLIATQELGPVRLRVNVENVNDRPYYLSGGFPQVYPQAPGTILTSVELGIGGRRRSRS